MKIFRNIPGAIKIYGNLRHLNKFKKEIDAARKSGDFIREREFILKATTTWGQTLSSSAGVKVNVYGRENLPTTSPVVFMANHQGYADIVTLCAALDTIQIGFVARNDLEAVPLYGKWIDRVRSVMIDRKNPKEGLKAIRKGIELLENGFSLVIFPEGTRSRGPHMNEFKAGAIKLATKPQVPIVPVSIDGTWKVFEEKGYLQKGEVNILIHPQISTLSLSKEEEKALPKKIFDIIHKGLETIRNIDEANI